MNVYISYLNCSLLYAAKIYGVSHFEELKMIIVMIVWHRHSLMGQEEAVALNTVAQKLIAMLTKLRVAEDKVIKALPTWSEEQTDDIEDVPSNANLVNY